MRIVGGSAQVVDGNALGYFDSGDQIYYGEVDLTDVKTVKFRHASASFFGKFELRIDHPGGQKILSHTVDYSGSYQNYIESSVDLISPVYGKRQLYLVGTSGSGIMNLDKMELIKGSMRVRATIEAEHYQHVQAGSVGRTSVGLGYFDAGDVVKLGRADWSGVSAIRFVHATGSTGFFELRVGGPNGTPVMFYTTQHTGGYDSYRTVTLHMPHAIHGWQDLYLVGVGGTGIMNLDKVQLLQNPINY